MKQKTILLSTLLIIITTCPLTAERSEPGHEWKSLVKTHPNSWYQNTQAVTIADNVLLYQRNTGGWPKNIGMHLPITNQKRDSILLEKKRIDDSTTDNDATLTELLFLAKVYQYHPQKQYKEAFERGVNYLLEAQYPNGGWPQFYPLKSNYSRHITYNDDSMYNILKLLREIPNPNGDYAAIADHEVDQKATEAYNKGVGCLLKSQIRVGDTLTVWCAQHDAITLQPTQARAYELASYSGKESAHLVELLMDIDHPSKEVIQAIEGAISWFKQHKLLHIKVAQYINNQGKEDRRVAYDSTASPCWARFYELETLKPLFCDRDGIRKYRLEDIGYERRNGYGWYTTEPAKVLKKEVKWRRKIAKMEEGSINTSQD